MDLRMSRLTGGITKNVVVISLVSFFNDIASEMIYPIVPVFLTTVLGAPITIVGLIEGIAESTASLLRIFSGWFSDKFYKRKGFMVAGYGFSTLSKLVMAGAFHWRTVLGARFLDRFGKGVRTSARDALLAESSEERYRGKVFGFHRGMDTLGALIGPLLALLILRYFSHSLRQVFILSAIPGAVGVVLLAMFVKDIRKKPTGVIFPLSLRHLTLNRNARVFLLVSAVFAMGNSSDVFLILRAQNLGLPLTLTVLAYTCFNAAYAFFSVPAGVISDRIGQKRVLLCGFALFALVYFLFGFITHAAFVWLLFPLYGIYMALTEGVGKAYMSLLLHKQYAGATYGLYQSVLGVIVFFASLIAGFLWKYFGPGAPFIFGGITAVVALILFYLAAEENL
jgi:MFS family permease